MKRSMFAISLLALLVSLFPLGVQAQAAAFGAFDPRLVPVEVQAWWTPTYGHVHAAALVPLGQTVSGIVSVPVRIVMHANPGKWHRFDIADDSGKDIATVMPGDKTCPAVCAWAITVNVDTTKEKSGWREWRMQTYIQTPDGKVLMTSSGIPVNVSNGGTRSDFKHPCNGTQLIGRAWYTSMDYTNAMIDCVPTAPVHGVVTFGVRAQKPSQHLTVDLDKSHYIPAVGIWPEVQDSAGVTLLDQAGDFQKFIPLTIDTTKLANGWHSIAVRNTSANSGATNGVTNRSEGVAKAWFYVEN